MPVQAGNVDKNGVLWNGNQEVGTFSGPHKGCSNLYETLVKSVAENGSKEAAGIRTIVETRKVGGFEKYRMSRDFQYLTYTEYLKEVDNLGSGLVQAVPSLEPNDTVVIYAETSRPWMISAYACWRQGLVVGTIYATLGEEGALFGINQSRCKVVIADAKLLKVLVKIAGQLKHLKDVITITEPSAEAVESLKKVGMNIHVMEGADGVIARGAKTPAEATPAKATPARDGKDTAVLMYTSGTTGNPKGVLISHYSILCNLTATLSPKSAIALDGRPFLRGDSTYLAYLPLAHIMELAVEVTCFAVGCKIGYGSPGTITAASIKMLQEDQAGNKITQLGDAALLGPTLFVAAPAVLDKVLVGIKNKFAALPSFIQKLCIEAAIENGKQNYDKGGVGCHGSYFISNLIFKKAQKLLGGKVGATPGPQPQPWHPRPEARPFTPESLTPRRSR